MSSVWSATRARTHKTTLPATKTARNRAKKRGILVRQSSLTPVTPFKNHRNLRFSQFSHESRKLIRNEIYNYLYFLERLLRSMVWFISCDKLRRLWIIFSLHVKFSHTLWTESWQPVAADSEIKIPAAGSSRDIENNFIYLQLVNAADVTKFNFGCSHAETWIFSPSTCISHAHMWRIR